MPQLFPNVKKILFCEHTIHALRNAWRTGDGAGVVFHPGGGADAKRDCHALPRALYWGSMSSEVQDYNAFNSWDSFGASLTLGIVPAIMNYVFTDPHDITGTVFIVVVALLISLLILGVALVTRWRIIGTLVNLAGCILTPIYIGIAVYCWLPDDAGEAPQPVPAAESILPPAP